MLITRAKPPGSPQAISGENEGDFGHLCVPRAAAALPKISQLVTVLTGMADVGTVAPDLEDIADQMAGFVDELSRRAARTPIEVYEASVRKELDDQAAEEMTVHVIEFPDRLEPRASS